MQKELNEFPLQQREFFFTFTNKDNQRCIVHLEEWENQLFAIKYHLKNHTRSDFRYNLSQGTNWVNARRVMNTCINIMLSAHQSFPLHSFCFIGSPRKDKKEETSKRTQRFRIYHRIITEQFSDAQFIYQQDEETSSYLMINKKALVQNAALLSRYGRMYETNIAALID